MDCFQKAGFDSVDAIDGMDGDTIIEEMEQYIDKRKHHYPSCIGPDGVPELPFEFPPGHKVRIKKFIKKVCSEKVSLKHPPSRVHKKATAKPPNGNSQDVNSVVNGIRQTIVSWAKKQDISLTENEHYTIEASQSLLMPGECKASIRCSCNESISIQKRPTGINKWIIGNWSRHLVKQKCYLKKPEGEKQGCLRKFFPSPSTNLHSDASTTINHLDTPSPSFLHSANSSTSLTCTLSTDQPLTPFTELTAPDLPVTNTYTAATTFASSLIPPQSCSNTLSEHIGIEPLHPFL